MGFQRRNSTGIPKPHTEMASSLPHSSMPKGHIPLACEKAESTLAKSNKKYMNPNTK